MLANARIKRFVTCGKYADDSFLDLFKEAGIVFDLQPGPPLKILPLD